LLQPGAGCYIVLMRHKHIEWPSNQFSGAFGVHAGVTAEAVVEGLFHAH
jgi:hypothetical protein